MHERRLLAVANLTTQLLGLCGDELPEFGRGGGIHLAAPVGEPRPNVRGTQSGVMVQPTGFGSRKKPRINRRDLSSQELGGLSREIAEASRFAESETALGSVAQRHPAVWSVVLRKKPALAN